ncbi:hypothetical protein GOBAR_DD15468 [Gossypium barbadense]|nr:hypothetical protein GOBAR_DD15468 [Gossypium barbadense]
MVGEIGYYCLNPASISINRSKERLRHITSAYSTVKVTKTFMQRICLNPCSRGNRNISKPETIPAMEAQPKDKKNRITMNSSIYHHLTPRHGPAYGPKLYYFDNLFTCGKNAGDKLQGHG